MAPVNTGRDNKSRIVVIKIDQINKEIWSNFKNLIFIFIIVEIKLIAPKIEEIPAIWSEKIEKSTEVPVWAIIEDKGG